MRQSIVLKGCLRMRETGPSFIILNNEDMLKTGLKLCHSVNIHIEQIQSCHSEENWNIYKTS